MFEVETSTGLVLSIDQDRLENYELFEAITDEENGVNGAMIRIVNLLLGDEAKRLKDHVRTEKGLVPISALGAEIKDIFEQVKDLKNSQSSPE
ncbi:hypothetical protein [Streptococcus suis]|uniref:Phage protein n=1 Tax=Streptococcus suis TaxID=1307 RepID=A0AB33UB52_STRSU|nr:hypothetical protein [Streptococcus suis]NQS06511.1 hypothetical protein [Streptococcus suis]QBX21617.1 hypothetical protein Javan583_0048 [Streptococcus phage Javan583]CYX61920.1 phage protein [Streptococcus suis]